MSACKCIHQKLQHLTRKTNGVHVIQGEVPLEHGFGHFLDLSTTETCNAKRENGGDDSKIGSRRFYTRSGTKLLLVFKTLRIYKLEVVGIGTQSTVATCGQGQMTTSHTLTRSEQQWAWPPTRANITLEREISQTFTCSSRAGKNDQEFVTIQYHNTHTMIFIKCTVSPRLTF